MSEIFRRLTEFLGAGRTEEAAPDNSSSMEKETNDMNGQEDQVRNQARTDSASSASVVELLTSILDQVKRQQVQTQVTAELDGEAERAVLIFREINTALDVETQSGIGGQGETNLQASVRRGRDGGK
jgi:hypothetical protein